MHIIKIIISATVGILLFFLLASLVPPARCNDGWNSPSIGRQGACSHHGGVKDYEALGMFIFFMSTGAGIFTYGIIPERRRVEKREKFSNNLLGTIEYAIANRKTVEFFYKTPTQYTPTKRVVRPIRVTNGGTCLTGFCEFRKAERTFALKRMQDFKILEDGTQPYST